MASTRPLLLRTLALTIVGASVLLLLTLERESTPDLAPTLTERAESSANALSVQSAGAFQSSHPEGASSVRFAAGGEQYVATVSSDKLTLEGPRTGIKSLDIHFAGASTGRKVVLTDRLPPDLGIFEIHRYFTARFSQVYPGVDAVYRSIDDELELDFEIAAGADPRLIRLVAAGEARFVPVVAHDNLQYRPTNPVAYQTFAGQRKAVAVKAVADATTLRFELGSYDTSRPVVIERTIRSMGAPAPRAADRRRF